MHRALLVTTLLLACRSSPALPPDDRPPCTPAGEPEPTLGEGTHYEADGTGRCSFDAVPAPDRMVAAINGAEYEHAKLCGACLLVTGPASQIVVRVVDICPGCAAGDLDLAQEAFALLAPLDVGRLKIAWRVVPCDVSGPVEYRFKDTSDNDWTAIQIRNHRYPIATLEARDARGNLRSLERHDDNYFVAQPGLGKGPYVLHVTDSRGHSVEAAVQPGAGLSRKASGQFARCPSTP